MPHKELRAELRAAVARKGALSVGEGSFPCVVQDMSDSGMLIMCARPLIVGQTLQFSCEIFPEQVLECIIEVVHIGDAGVGAKIIEINEASSKLIQLILQEYFAGSVKRWL